MVQELNKQGARERWTFQVEEMANVNALSKADGNKKVYKKKWIKTSKAERDHTKKRGSRWGWRGIGHIVEAL